MFQVFGCKKEYRRLNHQLSDIELYTANKVHVTNYCQVSHGYSLPFDVNV